MALLELMTDLPSFVFGRAANVAVTVLSAVIGTWHAPCPEQAPLQPVNAAAGFGARALAFAAQRLARERRLSEDRPGAVAHARVHAANRRRREVGSSRQAECPAGEAGERDSRSIDRK